MTHLFHLAIPSHDLSLSRDFYEELGAKIGRGDQESFLMDFFGDQVVCHLDRDSFVENPKMYPRHFGVIFKDEEEFQSYYSSTVKRFEEYLYQDLFSRHEGREAEHKSFFLRDPTGNLIEFKFYMQHRSIFN